MDIAQLQTFLGWCILINYGLLLIWFLAIRLAGGLIVNMGASWFDLEPAPLKAEHYHLMGQFKLLVMVFNLAPWLALTIMAR